MIELFINKHEVVLPEDFSFTLIEENPEITNNGEFTLDITLSLLEAKNVRAFNFLNRLNLTTIVKTADARLIIDGVVHLGSIIISKNTDTEVVFQFIAGNSQFNYNMRTDTRKIWELNWGEETTIDYAKALDSITNPNNYNFVCAPVEIGGVIYNDYTVTQDTLVKPTEISGVNRILMQPYIKYYINKLPSLLGFELKNNVLNSDNRLKYMYVINCIDSLKYSDALPDITIADFIVMIENYFNIYFICNSRDNTISIENQSSLSATKKNIKISNVFDSYERAQDQTPIASRYGFTRISYDLPTNIFFKYQCISDSILEKCQVLNFNTFQELTNAANNETQQNSMKLWVYEEFQYFFGEPNTNMFAVKVNNGKLNLINKFRSHGTNDDSVLLLKFVPATMKPIQKLYSWYNGMGQQLNAIAVIQLPVAENSYYIPIYNNFVDRVEKDDPQLTRRSNFQVALFSGMLKMCTADWSVASGTLDINYPFSHIDRKPEFFSQKNTSAHLQEFLSWFVNEWNPYISTTLKIEGDGGIADDYKLSSIFDTTKEYTLVLTDSPDINVGNLFQYNNMLYFPISFEREKSTNQKTVTGKFYRML